MSIKGLRQRIVPIDFKMGDDGDGQIAWDAS